METRLLPCPLPPALPCAALGQSSTAFIIFIRVFQVTADQGNQCTPCPPTPARCRQSAMCNFQITTKKNCNALVGRGRGRGWGRTTGLTANPSRQAKSERAFFAYYRPRHGLPPHSAKCSSNQRCSSCAASLTPLPLGRLLPRFVATFYAFFQRLRRRLLFQLQDKCDSIKPCHAPKTQQNMPQCRAAPPPRCPAPSLHRRAAKNCQA